MIPFKLPTIGESFQRSKHPNNGIGAGYFQSPSSEGVISTMRQAGLLVIALRLSISLKRGSHFNRSSLAAPGSAASGLSISPTEGESFQLTVYFHEQSPTVIFNLPQVGGAIPNRGYAALVATHVRLPISLRRGRWLYKAAADELSAEQPLSIPPLGGTTLTPPSRPPAGAPSQPGQTPWTPRARYSMVPSAWR